MRRAEDRAGRAVSCVLAVLVGACAADVEEDYGGLSGPLTATEDEAVPAIGLAPHDLSPAQLDTLPANNVTTARVGFPFWLGVTTDGEGTAFDGRFDPVVRAHAERGIHILPVLSAATEISPGVGALRYVVKEELGQWERFAASLAERYGPAGTFWTDNPELPYLPMRAWEIWNEPNLQTFWDDVEMSRPNARHYRRILRRAFIGLRMTDPRARVVLGGLSFPRDNDQNVRWKELLGTVLDGRNEATRTRNRCLVDAVAIHPYASTVPESMAKVQEVYDFLERRGMTGKNRERRDVQIWITELGWAVPVPGEWPADGNNTVESELAQARRVSRAIREMDDARGRLRLGPLYWYSFSDLPGFHTAGDGDGKWPDYAGLWTLWGKDEAGNETIPGRARPGWLVLGNRAGAHPPLRLPPVRCTLGDTLDAAQRSLRLLAADDLADADDDGAIDAVDAGMTTTPSACPEASCLDATGREICAGERGVIACEGGTQICQCDPDGTFSFCTECTAR